MILVGQIFYFGFLGSLNPIREAEKVAKIVSGHYPIFLDSGGMGSGRKYFKSENMRLKDESFVEVVGLL